MGSGRGRIVNITPSATEESYMDSVTIDMYTPPPSTSFGVRGKNLVEVEGHYQSEEYSEMLKEKGLNTFNDVLNKQGFLGVPKQVTQDGFDYIVANGGVKVSRGVSANTKEELESYTEQFLSGDFYINGGEAYFGSGMYAFGGEYANTNATQYGNVTDMVLSPDANILTLDVGEHYGFSDKEILDTFYVLKDRQNESRQNSSYKEPEYNSEGRLSKEVEIAQGNSYSLRQVGLTPKEVDINLMYTDPDAYFSQKDSVKAHNMKIGREYLTTKSSLSPHDVDLVYRYLTGDGKVPNPILVAKGYDAVRYTPEYVQAHSSNGAKEIVVVFNRTKLAVATLKGDSNVSSQSSKGLTYSIDGKEFTHNKTATSSKKGYFIKRVNGYDYTVDANTGAVLKKEKTKGK